MTGGQKNKYFQFKENLKGKKNQDKEHANFW